MAIKTPEEQLESVQGKIEAVEGGAQSYELDGRTVTYPTLEKLYARETVLLQRMSRPNLRKRVYSDCSGGD